MLFQGSQKRYPYNAADVLAKRCKITNFFMPFSSRSLSLSPAQCALKHAAAQHCGNIHHATLCPSLFWRRILNKDSAHHDSHYGVAGLERERNSFNCSHYVVLPPTPSPSQKSKVL
jgi:hypothetical protein